MEFPLFYLLIVYLAFIFIWLFFCGVVLYHMFKYGHKTAATYSATAVFLIVSITMLLASFYYIAGIDWSRNVAVFEIFFNNL